MNANEAANLVSQSGNSFQCRVAQYFREKGWQTLLCPYYVDAATDKQRETDLVVEQRFAVPQMWSGPRKCILVRLYIECKYISQGTVFWYDKMDSARTLNWVERKAQPFKENYPGLERHHYFSRGDEVAKLFSTERRGEENDPVFRAINQCLNGYLYNANISPLVKLIRNEDVTMLRYPVIVCSSFADFYRVSVMDDTPPVPVADNFMLEMNYAYFENGRANHDFFQVDVVDFGKLDQFLASIEAEVEAAKHLLADN